MPENVRDATFNVNISCQGLWGAICLEIEKIGLSEQIQTEFGLIFGE